MKKPPLFLCVAVLLTAPNLATAAEALDPRLVGSWQGMREQTSECRFLAWNSTFSADGRFEISFFVDEDKLAPLQTERGSWKASNGRSELATDGVRTPEVYLYSVVDQDSIHYVNTVKDPTADCQADYAFTEHRVKP